METRHVLFLVMAALAVSTPASADIVPMSEYTLTPKHLLLGDANENGVVNVSDIQCGVLVTLSELGGGTMPECLVAEDMDLNCDSAQDVADVLISIAVALEDTLSPGIDSNNDGFPDACQFTNRIICEAKGEEGQEFPCPLYMVRKTESTPLVAATQFTMWSNTPTDVVFTFNFDTGHSLTTDSAGSTVLIANLNDGTAPLFDAYLLSDTEVEGDPLVGFITITLPPGASPEVPIVIGLDEIQGSTLDAEEMYVYVQNNTLFFSKACDVGDDCDDGDACTEDLCNEGGGCDISTVVCDDDLECTDDACDPSVGCVSTPNETSCDDGLECTIDECDPELGCIATPSNESCDDGNPCTQNTCDLTEGCTSANKNGSPCSEGDNPCFIGYCEFTFCNNIGQLDCSAGEICYAEPDEFPICIPE